MWILFSQIYHLMKLLKCVNELFKSSQTDLWHNKQQVLERLLLTTKENVLLFGQKSRSQIDGVAMGSPLGPTLDNIFLCHHETTWLKNSLKSFKCIIKDTLMTFLCCLKIRNNFYDLIIIWIKDTKNIKFSFEIEKGNPFSFLDVRICREKGKSTTSVFRKDTFSGVCTNFSSFVGLEHKFDLVCTSFYTEDLRLGLIFPNFILKLQCLRKHFKKILISQNLLINV